jgi:hypothetical protein
MNRRLRARTYLDGTQLGMRSGPCWKCCLPSEGRPSGNGGSVTATGPLWAGLKAPDQRPSTGATGRCSSCCPAAGLGDRGDRGPRNGRHVTENGSPARCRPSSTDLVEVYNDSGSTQAVAYPTPTAKRKQTFMLFAQRRHSAPA